MITSGTIDGKATRVSGRRLYCEAGRAAAAAETNALDGYANLRLFGALAGDAITGGFRADGSPLDGTFTMTR